ncbi:MAG: hypothetical protein AAFR38_05845 [Planctomycetota bacterium]
MSQRVCYIQRVDRGAVLTSARLLGHASDAGWTAPARSEDEPALETPRKLADWIASELAPSRSIDRLVLDADGTVCSWLRPPEQDPALIKAMVEQRSGSGDALSIEESGEAGRFPDLPGEITIEPIAPPASGGSGSLTLRRKRGGDQNGSLNGHTEPIPLLASPDAPARALIDALDARGIETQAVLSIFHALAQAWDAVASSATEHEGFVADQRPVAATVLLDPAGRLVWAWSRGGVLLAAGSQRIGRHDDSGRLVGAVTLRRGGVGRLMSEWLAWSAQLGVSPARVRLIGDLSSEALFEPGFGPADAMRELTARWPGALAEATDEEDPIGATMDRLLGVIDRGDSPEAAREGGRAALTGLATRRGRPHRRMYRFASVAALAGFALCVAGSIALDRSAESELARAESIREAQAQLVLAAGFTESEANDLDLLGVIGDKVAAARLNSQPAGLRPPPPVLEELENLSFVAQSSEDIRLERMGVTELGAEFRAVVPDTAAFEQLSETLFNIAGFNLIWENPIPQRQQDGVRLFASAVWTRQAAGDER